MLSFFFLANNRHLNSVKNLLITFVFIVSNITVPGYASQYIERPFFSSEKEVEKLMRPVRALNKRSSIDDVAKAAAIFKTDLDKSFYTGISIETAFDLTYGKMVEMGTPIKKKKLDAFAKKARKHEKTLKREIGFLDDYELKKQDEKQEEVEIDMPVMAVIGCVEIFCGVLLCILPYGATQAVGASAVLDGTNRIINAYIDEKDDKKKRFLELYLPDPELEIA